MARGKQTCKILKEICRQIAEANGIEFITSECRYKGDCLGTCPKCEAEVRYLEQQLRAHQHMGKAVVLNGISVASLAMLIPISSEASSPMDIKITPADSVAETCIDSVKIKGIVKYEYRTKGDSIATEELIGATVLNLTTGKGTATDIDGKFEIDACKGDSIKVSFIGYLPKTISVKDTSEPIIVVLDENSSELMGEVVLVGAFGPQKSPNGMLDLIIVDEKGNRINPSDVNIYKIYIDEDGDEASEYLYPTYIDDDTALRFYWDEDSDLQNEDGKPLKNATLRITADGYDEPVIIKVKYPKRNAKKTIKFKHKKKYGK